MVHKHPLEPAHVTDVHDLDVWTVASDLSILSAHIVLDDACFNDGHAPEVLEELCSRLVGHFDVDHGAIQLAPAHHFANETGRVH